MRYEFTESYVPVGLGNVDGCQVLCLFETHHYIDPSLREQHVEFKEDQLSRIRLNKWDLSTKHGNDVGLPYATKDWFMRYFRKDFFDIFKKYPIGIINEIETGFMMNQGEEPRIITAKNSLRILRNYLETTLLKSTLERVYQCHSADKNEEYRQEKMILDEGLNLVDSLKASKEIPINDIFVEIIITPELYRFISSLPLSTSSAQPSVPF